MDTYRDRHLAPDGEGPTFRRGSPGTVLVLLALLAGLLPGVISLDPATAAPTIGTACPRPSIPATDLTDATGTHGDAIRCLAWYGVTQGRTATSFGARDDIDRGQAASLLVRLLDRADIALPSPTRGRFGDLRGNVHRDAVERLAEAGVYLGTAPGVADARATITREQFASLVVRVVELAEETALPAGADRFDDVGGTHRPNVGKAARAGFLEGVGSGRFAPRDRLSRQQAASVVARVLDRFVVAGRLQPPPEPSFRWESSALPRAIRDEMIGVSWESGCPVALADLRLVVLTHRGFDGRIHRGELVVHRSVVSDLRTVFGLIYAEDFPLAGAARIERFGGDDDRSMAANNTSAFNCRRVTGGSAYSEHSHGTAIDINPVQNPYHRGSTVLPPAGRDHLDRSEVRPGMLVEGDAIVRRFDELGWTWGGRWQTLSDPQHFERPRG